VYNKKNLRKKACQTYKFRVQVSCACVYNVALLAEGLRVWSANPMITEVE